MELLRNGGKYQRRAAYLGDKLQSTKLSIDYTWKGKQLPRATLCIYGIEKTFRRTKQAIFVAVWYANNVWQDAEKQ